MACCFMLNFAVDNDPQLIEGGRADAGMNAHLSKPVEPHELYDILKMLISEYRKES